MQQKILDGKTLATKIQNDLAIKIKNDLAENKAQPNLVVILVGEQAASKVYVEHKIKACENIGMLSTLKKFSIEVSEDDLLKEIIKNNKDKNVHGILVQLPLPKHINMEKVLETIDPLKDVDGFHKQNAGALFQGKNTQTYLQACTPLGCMELLKEYKINTLGKHAVIVGASNIVGKPISMMLLQAGATVTICNSKTPDISAHTKLADIIIMAVGKPNMLTSTHIKAEAVVIDVGINRLENGKLCGDAATLELLDKVSFISPVPGGVGPMTIAMLLSNTYKAMQLQQTS